MKKVLFTATVDSHILHFHIPYLKWFKEQGYEVHVATNGDEQIPYCDVKHKVDFKRSPFKFNNLRAIQQLKKIINEEKFEIIHCHTPMGGVVTRLAARKVRKNEHTKVIYTAHGFHFFKGAPIQNWLIFYPIEKWLSKSTDCLITINEEDYRLAKKKFHAQKIELVHGVGIEKEKFNFEMTKQEKQELRQSLGLEEDDFVILYVAELNNNKNQIMLIEAMKNLVKENKKVVALLVGKGDYLEYYTEKIKEYQLEKNIILMGYRKDVPKLLKITNLYVATSKREGLPLNIVEALSCEVPVIATNIRGHNELVHENENGYLIDLNNIDQLESTIKKCIQENSKQYYFNVEQYGIDEVMDNIIKIYKEV